MYIMVWFMLIALFVAGFLVPIFWGRGFTAIGIFVFISPLMIWVMSFPWLSGKVRRTKSLKAFILGTVNAHKRLWHYFTDLDDDALVYDMINGD